MPTLYTHAIRFADSTDSGSAPADAIYNDLATLGVAMLMRYSTPNDLTLWSKGNTGNALNATLIGSDGRVDLRVNRSGNASLFRGDAITTDNAWRWACFTLNRSTGAHTRVGGAKGGSLAVLSQSDINAGSGAVSSDAAFPFTIGSNGLNAGATILEFAFVGIWSIGPSLAQWQAIADDLSTAVQPIAAWKPDAGTTTSIANYIGGAPSMTLSGSVTVAGPDAGGGGGPVTSRRRRLLMM